MPVISSAIDQNLAMGSDVETRAQTRTGPRVVVAGQLPPPLSGQNLNIARVIRILSNSDRFDVAHWKFHFNPSWKTLRRATLGKAVELVLVWFRLLQLRLAGPIDVLLFPVGGPHALPVFRDIALLPFALLSARHVVLHFQAAGLADALPHLPKPAAWTLGKLYSRCHRAVVLSEFGRADAIAAGIANDRIEVILNAVEDRYQPTWIERNSEPGTPFTVLNVGLLCSDKGTPHLLRAFAKAHQTYPEMKLQLVGEPMGDLTEESILREARQLGIESALELTGPQTGEALQRAYATADAFAFTSIAPFESFGIVLIEAMMWELPIIATDWRANGEVVGGPSRATMVPVSGDLTDDLANALEQAIANRAAHSITGQRNREYFLAHYKIDLLEQRLIDYLETTALAS